VITDELARRIRQGGGHAHLVGIGGVGMAGLAHLLRARGWRVSGCDQAGNRLTDWLAGQGIICRTGHDEAHLDDAVDAVIRTTAVPADHPEIRAAEQRGIPVWRRGPVLAALAEGARCVAVSGTHGKTTTTACITHLLREAGFDPGFFVGGEAESLGGVAGAGAGAWLVIEADESDGTLIHYRPEIAVITNVDYDHMEHFRAEQEFFDSFRAFAGQATRKVVYCADDEGARRTVAVAGATAYGLSPSAEVRADSVALGPESSLFDLWRNDRKEGAVELPVPGAHNVLNALAACAVAFDLGIPFETIRRALAGFRPVKRRFERISDAGDVWVVSDYAHHPAEIRALVKTATRHGRRLVAVFQPHRYTRTRALGAQFPPAFEGVEHLVLAPVYEASEAPLPGGSSRDLEAHFRAFGRVPMEYADSLEEAWTKLRVIARPGDMLLVVGAGDVEKIGFWAKTHYEIASTRP
jgi:UDP-N-acetylmuramate--alanine ligase